MFDINTFSIPFLFGIPILIYSMLKLFRLIKGYDNSRIDVAKMALAMSYASLGDPRYYIWFFMILMLVALASIGNKKHFIKIAKMTFLYVLITIPTVIYVYFVFVSSQLSPIYVSQRMLTLSNIIFLSDSNKPMQVFQLLGNWWPTPIMAPPPQYSFPTDRLK